jgi:16S rRNA processing protein RimM
MSAGDRLVVGQVRGLHGLRGAVRVESLTDREDERFAVGRKLYVEGSKTPLTIAAAQPDNQGWRLRFVELSDRTAVEALRDVYLEVVVESGESLPDGEFYWHEIIGAKVTDTAGRLLGTVTDIYRAGGAEVAVVAGDKGELDVPLIKAVVKNLDPKAATMVVDAEALGLEESSAQDATE